mmetsp:Transcript_41697/g.129133  ORF Transcript_41697/g.129133 Transcript_41697/m.129133 type:complete len:264 (-) Transcript_41697:306-1097(-)
MSSASLGCRSPNSLRVFSSSGSLQSLASTHFWYCWSSACSSCCRRSARCLFSSLAQLRQAALSALFSVMMFSLLRDLTSSLPPSSRSSTSQRPLAAGRGSLRSTTPRLPLRCGAFCRPQMTTAWPLSSSFSWSLACTGGFAAGAGACGGACAASGGAPPPFAFFSAAMSSFRTWLETIRCISAVAASNFRPWASERSRFAFRQFPSLRWAVPRMRYALTIEELTLRAAVQSRTAAQGRRCLRSKAPLVASIMAVEPPVRMASV